MSWYHSEQRCTGFYVVVRPHAFSLRAPCSAMMRSCPPVCSDVSVANYLGFERCAGPVEDLAHRSQIVTRRQDIVLRVAEVVQ